MATATDPTIALGSDTRQTDPKAARAGFLSRVAAAFRSRSAANEKRAYFTERWVGIALIVPQLLLIFTFFYWPAGEALYWAFTLERPWGGGNQWVGLGKFAAVLGGPGSSTLIGQS